MGIFINFMWQTFGHQAVKQLLDKQLKRGQFPHAYLFVGPQGIGKKTLAREMASQILDANNLDSHADYIYYDAGDGNGMEGLRQFLSRLNTKPFIGKYKVAIIDNMDRANPQMSNALLKTLEEPSPSTILFVVAGQNNLLPTIISRCQLLPFNSLTSAELIDYAKYRKLKTTELLLASSFGSPARLETLIRDPERAEQINSSVTQLETAQGSGTAEKLLAVNALSELEPEQLRDILLTWMYRQRLILAQQPARGQTMGRICEALEHLNGSFNKKMVLQRLLLSPL